MLEPWHRDLLHQCRVARLATVGPAGQPHIVPVCYALIGDTVAIPVDEKPRRPGQLQRLRNIARDPRVSFLADRYDHDDWTCLAWVRIDGHARALARGSDWPESLAALRARYRQYYEMALEELPLIVVEAGRVAAWRWPPGSAR